MEEAESIYRQLYETHAPMMRFMADLNVPLPQSFQVVADFALNSSLRHMFEDPDNLDFVRIASLLEEVRSNNLNFDGPTLGFALKNTIHRLSQQLMEKPDDMALVLKFEAAAGIAKTLPFEVSVWRAQNNYYSMLQHVMPDRNARAQAGDAEACDLALVEQREDELMRCLKNLVALGSKSYQVADVEEAAVIDAVGRLSPVRQPIVLPLENAIHVVITEIFRACRDRQLLPVILNQRPVVLDVDNEFTIFEHFAVGLSEDRKQDFVGFPVHVEERCVRRVLALFQHIEPPRILEAGGHVIRNDIQNQAHSPVPERAAKRIELFGGADLGIDDGGVGDVIAVGAAGASLQNR
jgi:hypothetical protein